MGRGRAKAKQTKVARRLKYDTGGTDLDALRAEIVGDDPSGAGEDTAGQRPDDASERSEDGYSDLYAKYAEDEDDERAARHD